MKEMVRRFLARTFSARTSRFEIRVSPEERAAYEVAARIEGGDASGWVRMVLSREARKVLE